MNTAPKCVRGIVVLLLVLMSTVDIRAADTTPPLILSKSPTGTLIDTALNLSVTTNENSVCKYDTLNVLYNDMRNLFPGSSLTHVQPLTLSNGDYIYYVRCKDTSDNIMTSSSVISFTIDSTGGGDVSAPSIVDYAPQETINDVTPDLVAVTNEESTCKYSTVDQDYNLMTELMGGTINHVAPLSLTAGNYLYYVRCRDASGNTMSNSFEIEFGIDNMPPDVLDYSPTVANTNSVELEISTNENAYCRYSISSSSYEEMGNVFDVTGHKIHRTDVEFSEDGFQELFIRCQDRAGNSATQDYSAIIDVDTPPTAEIFLSQDSPIKPGTVQVTVFTSEPLIGTPTLAYDLHLPNGEVNSYGVPLSGNDRTWQGFMIISGSQDRRIGDFKFRGIDFGGNEGSLITSGNTFIVDSTQPDKVENIIAEALSDGDIRLEWDYDNDDEIGKYIIYRALSQGVSTLDYYDEATSKSYTDEDVYPNTAYYYKIIAVDEAGNKGLLSKEVSARTAVDEGYVPTQSSGTDSTVTEELQSNLIPLVDESVAKYRAFQKTADDMVLYYRGNPGLTEEVIQHLGLLTTASAVKGQVNKYILELQNLKRRDLNVDDLQEEIRSIELKLESQKSKLPLQATLGKTFNLENEITLADTNEAIDGILNLYRIIDIETSIRERYARESAKIQEAYSVNGTAKQYTIKYYDGSSEEVLLVHKQVIPAGDKVYDNALVIEYFPDSVVERVSDVTFIGQKPSVLKQDASVKFNLNERLEVTYTVPGSFSALNSIDILSIILDDNTLYFDELGNEPSEEKGDAITGNLIRNTFSNPTFKNVGGIILGVLVVAGLAIYYFTMDGEGGNPNKPNKPNKVSAQNKQTELPQLQHKTKITRENAVAMLEKAHALIDALQFNDANEIYSELVSKHVTSLDQEQMNYLFKKLDMYMNMHHAEIASKKNDFNDLYAKLSVVAELYNEVCDEQNCNNALMTYVKNEYDRYASTLTGGSANA
jgi:hypothetical protein